MWMKKKILSLTSNQGKVVKAVKYFYLSSGKIITMMVMIKISNIGKTWEMGLPLVQPCCKSALQKLVKLKMHRPWELSTPHAVPAYRNISTCAPECSIDCII